MRLIDVTAFRFEFISQFFVLYLSKGIKTKISLQVKKKNNRS